MIEETIEPYTEEMVKLRELSLFHEEKEFCMGILKGLKVYEKESKSEFKDWSTDMPGEVFSWVLDEWKETQNDEKIILEMEEFVKALG